MAPDVVEARAELAPTGTLRVALNDANFLLVCRDAAGLESGLAPALGHELARRLRVPIAFVHYADAGLMARAVHSDEWDVGLLGIDTDRPGIAFTEPYVEIDAGYLVPPGSPLTTTADVDRPGVRIAVAERSAYDLYLTRALKHAAIVRAPGIGRSYEAFVDERLEALAGLKPRLFEDAQRLPGSRVLEGRFQAIQQGAGTPATRRAAAAYLRNFIREAKTTGLLRALAAQHGVRGVSIPE